METCGHDKCGNLAPPSCSNSMCADHCEGGCGTHKGGGKLAAKKREQLEKQTARLQRIREERERLRSVAKPPPAPVPLTRWYGGEEDGAKEEEDLLRAIEASRFSNEWGFTPPAKVIETEPTEEQISTIKAILPDFSEETIKMALKMKKGDTERAIDFLFTLPTPETKPGTNNTTTTTTVKPLISEPAPPEVNEEEVQEQEKQNLMTAEEFKTLKPKKQLKLFLELQRKVELYEQERIELKTTIHKQDREIYFLTGGYGFEVWKQLQQENVTKLQGKFEKECVVCLEEREGEEDGLLKTSCGCQVICKDCYLVLKKPRHCPQCYKPIK